MSYSRFINGLHQAGVEVDRKVLADLAVTDADAFAALVAVAAEAPGRRRGRFLSQALAYSHQRVRRLRRLLQKRATRWAERVFVAEGTELIRTALAAGAVPEALYVGAEGPGRRRRGRPGHRGPAVGGAGLRPGPRGAGQGGRHGDPPAGPGHVRHGRHRARGPRRRPAGGGLADVRDPGNAGTVLRSADAAGADAVVCCGGTVDPYNPKTVRASAGSLFHVPLVVLASVDEAAGAAGSARLPARSGHRSGAGEDYTAVDWRRPTALVLGNEAAGLPGDLALDGAVGIPMAGRAESLNVGVACAVLCFEALRQRRAGS